MCIVTFSASGREIYHNPPAKIAASTSWTDTVGPDVVSLDYHWRVNLPTKDSRPHWEVSLSYADSSHIDISITRLGTAIDDGVLAAPVEVSIAEYAADNAAPTITTHRIAKTIDTSIDGWSTVISSHKNDPVLKCRIGQRRKLLSFDLPKDGLVSITSTARTPMELWRLTSSSTKFEPQPVNRFDDIESLLRHIAASTNQSEAVWVYLDRNTNPRVIDTGGDYVLATIGNDRIGYDIIYLKGARTNAEKWQPLMLKGRLEPTTFIGHFNLVWYDAFGARIDRETSADIINGSIMQLNLPLHGGTVRFRRAIDSEVQPLR